VAPSSEGATFLQAALYYWDTAALQPKPISVWSASSLALFQAEERVANMVSSWEYTNGFSGS